MACKGVTAYRLFQDQSLTADKTIPRTFTMDNFNAFDDPTQLSPNVSHDAQAKSVLNSQEQGAQPGIVSPSASVQTHLLIVRLNLATTFLTPHSVSQGLQKL